jgi:hypothetical protein
MTRPRVQDRAQPWPFSIYKEDLEILKDWAAKGHNVSLKIREAIAEKKKREEQEEQRVLNNGLTQNQAFVLSSSTDEMILKTELPNPFPKLNEELTFDMLKQLDREDVFRARRQMYLNLEILNDYVRRTPYHVSTNIEDKLDSEEAKAAEAEGRPIRLSPEQKRELDRQKVREAAKAANAEKGIESVF